MLVPQKILTLAIVLGHCTNHRALGMLREDLGIENNPLMLTTIQDSILDKAKPRNELCLNCLSPTIYESSFELQVGCDLCISGDKTYLWHLSTQLGLEQEGRDRKVLMQFVYQTLEEIGAI